MTTINETLELLDAIKQGRVDAEVARRADDMLRLSVILLERLGGETTITVQELMSDTRGVEVVVADRSLSDPLAGHRVWLVKPQNRTSSEQGGK